MLTQLRRHTGEMYSITAPSLRWLPIPYRVNLTRLEA